MPRFQPNLGVAVDFTKIIYPVLGSPKLDGWRCLVHDGYAYPLTRTLKPVPNLFVKDRFERARLQFSMHGLDGELIVGPPNAEDVYTKTEAGLSRFAGTPDFLFYIFDDWSAKGGFLARQAQLQSRQLPSWAVLLQHQQLNSREEVEAFFQEMLALGFEGIVLRNPIAPYKFGRSTHSAISRRTGLAEQGLLKYKPEESAEAVILSVSPRMVNYNPMERDERGYAKRSTAMGGRAPINDLGNFLVRGINGDFAGVEFECAPGRMTQQTRQQLWNTKESLPGRIITYVYFPIGGKDRPRHPRFKGFRVEMELMEENDG